jgi:hypothetical protein
MSDLSLKKSTQFFVNEIVIVTKAGKIDVTTIYEEINIFDSILSPVMSGTILLKDSTGLSGKLLFDGSESILIEILKDKDSDLVAFKKAFRIYKQSNRSNPNQNSELYILHFVSDELIFSDQQRINQSYENTYTEIVKKILENYLKVPQNNLGGVINDSVGLRKLVIPNLRPLEAIEWCAKRAVDENQSPDFIFFQNQTGYNFATLSNLLTNDDILDIKFQPKNLTKTNPFSEISMAREIEVIAQDDVVERTRSGVAAGKFIGFDPMTRTIAVKNISFSDHYDKMKHSNDNPNISQINNRDQVSNFEAFDSKKTVNVFGAARQLSNYIKKYEPESLSKEDNQEEYIFQRRALIKNLMARRVKLTMPGNFQLTSGFNVNLDVQNFAQKSKDDDNTDFSLTGKYMIVASRQIIGFDKHETIIEVATSSTSNDFIPASNPDQTSELLGYA